MMWLQRQDSFKHKFGNLDQQDDAKKWWVYNYIYKSWTGQSKKKNPKGFLDKFRIRKWVFNFGY